MKNTLLFILLLTNFIAASGQLNFKDSLVNVIGYWDLNEQHEYSVSLQKLKIKGDQDTILNEMITYDVVVTIIDSTDKNYVVRWDYKNHKTKTANEIVKAVMKEAGNVTVDIITDENGSIQEIKNWEEVRDYMNGASEKMLKDIPNKSELEKIVNPLLSVYKTKAGIEATAIQDAQQLYVFHGSQYSYKEAFESDIERENFITKSKKPIKGHVKVFLQEMNEEDNNYVIRSITEYDSDQMTDLMHEVLSEMSKGVGQKSISRSETPQLSITFETVSSIHNSGWVLDSTQWKETITDGVTQIEIRKIVFEK